jgi:hypothetical protein
MRHFPRERRLDELLKKYPGEAIAVGLDEIALEAFLDDADP